MTQTATHHHKAADIRDEGRWQKFVGKVKDMFGDVTDNDMLKFRGKEDQAIGYIKEKYGAAADTLQDWWERNKS